MILALLGLPETPLNQFLSLAVGGLFFYFGMSGLSYLIFFVWGRARFHPGYQPDAEAERLARKWGTIDVLGHAVLLLPFHIALAQGFSRVYWDLEGNGGVPWLLVSTLLYFAFTETCVYWAHRWLHTVPFLYKHVHHIHHQWKVPTSWVSMAFHPLDSFLQAVPNYVFIMLVPLHGYVYVGTMVMVALWSVIIHDRVSFVRWKLINYTDHHTVHHWCYDFNYGQFTTIWDRIMGSYRDPDVLAKTDPGLRDAMWRPAGAAAPEVAAPAE